MFHRELAHHFILRSLPLSCSSPPPPVKTNERSAFLLFPLFLSLYYFSLFVYLSLDKNASLSFSLSFSISVHARATVCSREVKRAKWRGKQWTRRMLLGQAFFDRKYFTLTKSHSRLNDELLLLLLLFLVIIPLIPPYFKLASKEPPLSTEKAFPSPSGWIILFSIFFFESRNFFERFFLYY